MPGTETGLLTKAVARDTAALSTLLERYGPRVAREIRIDRKWQSLLSAEDVMQVTYLEAFLLIGRFDPRGEGSFRAWLRRIAENNLRDAIKGLRRAKRPSPARQVTPSNRDDSYITLFGNLTGTGSTPSHHVARDEAQGILDGAIARLPPDYERVVRQLDLADRSVTEVASSLGRSKGAVHMLRARAHDRLRELLGSATRYFTDSP